MKSPLDFLLVPGFTQRSDPGWAVRLGPFLTLLLTWSLVGSLMHAAEGEPAPLSAKWIWRSQAETAPYNQTVVARKSVRLEGVRQATMRITADSFYRLRINGRWVGDGPCRSWPEHYQYDELDVTTWLHAGANDIEVIARFYGAGDFHRVPRQAGLLAQLDVTLLNGATRRVVTDQTWQVAEARAWVSNTPKVSIQMEPAEWYDARLASDLKFNRARVICGPNDGPWKDLNPRDVALLTREPFAPRAFVGARAVRARGWNFCLPAARLVNPGLIEANNHVSCAAAIASVIETPAGCKVTVQNDNMRVAIDGQEPTDGRVELGAGRHVVLAFVRNIFGHDKEKSLRFLDPQDFRLVNPLDARQANPWVFLRFPEYAVATNDLLWIGFTREDKRLAQASDGYGQTMDRLLKAVKTEEDLKAQLGSRAEQMPAEKMFVLDATWQFQHRQDLGDASSHVTRPAALMHDTAEATVVQPDPRGDVELLYDLGEQNVGYYDFELTAPAGVVVDIFSLEHIERDGRIQHSWGNRNGMRYITAEGYNRFTSLKRRSGRFVFITLRDQKSPVQIRRFQLIESTYPVNSVGSFTCSDARLDAIWAISTRTLKLCMEDTFTDCPLYEQTHWVGDARNESLFAFGAFGAEDLARRCVRITAQSLERYPIAGCQTPSGWDVLLPAWSFLWGISTWDYYWQTGDKAFLREVWPAVIRNLKGAEGFVNPQGLFSGAFWNFFDWTAIDQGPKTVFHNSMFVVGAIDAALRCGDALNDHSQDDWLKGMRARLVAGINKHWNVDKGAYPDSIRDDGSVSPSTCQHTSFLSVLYDILEPDHMEQAKRNLMSPPQEMVKVGSPFAMLYFYGALEKLGMQEEIVRDIYARYLPMLEAGATTVWESFPTGTTGSGGFPTRSHCHAWSSAPTYYLNRIILGVEATAPGGAVFRISPRLNGLQWARGTVLSTRGPLRVAWRLEGDLVKLSCQAPDGVGVEFASNPSLVGKRVEFNGKLVD